MIDTKINLQGAIDKGVYKGAEYLSHAMNDVADLNRKFRKEYLDKKDSFLNLSEDNKEWIDKQIKELNENQKTLYVEMNDILDAGYREANKIAKNIIKDELDRFPQIKAIRYENLYGSENAKMFEVINDCDANGNCLNKELLFPSEIKGPSEDPYSYDAHQYEVYKYLIKSQDLVALAGEVHALYMPPFMPEFFAGKDKNVYLNSVSAVQPYKGSIKHFSFNEDDSFLYMPAFVAVRGLVPHVDVEH